MKVDKAKMWEMKQAGKSVREIADAFHVKVSTVNVYLWQMEREKAKTQAQATQAQAQEQEQEKTDTDKASLPNAGVIA